jgi:FkbM family methyltransferase
MIRQITAPDGQPFWIPTGSNLVTIELEEGTYWEPYLLALFPLCCSPEKWTVEVGSYIGDHTIELAKFGPVIAFEPQPLPWACLGLNLAVRPQRYGWTTCRTPLYSSVIQLDQAPGWEPDHPSNGYQRSEQGVWTQTFDGGDVRDPVGFFKVDAQGCDLQVLIGAEETIRRDRPIVLCEFEPALAALHGDEAEDYRGWFRQHMYAFRGFLGGNILGVPYERETAQYWRALTDQGIELTT